MYASMPDTICYALSTQRRVLDTEAVIIPRKIIIIIIIIIKIIKLVSPTSRGKTPKAPLLWRILRKDWRDTDMRL